MSAKIATVVGATGRQGSGVVSVLLQKPEYTVRGITRSRHSAAARDLEAKGVQVFAADASDEASLRKAFAGSHLVFGITDYETPYMAHGPAAAKKAEIEHGSNIVRAAQATPTLEHFIWSTLPSIFDISEGRLHATNFDGKAEVDKLIRSNASLLAKTTFLMVGWYDSNILLAAFTPVWVPSANRYIIVGDYPADAVIPTIGSVGKNIQPFISAIIAQPQKTKSAIVAAYMEKDTFEGLLRRWAAAQGGKEATYVKTDTGTVYKLWPRGADLANMTRFMGAYREGFWTLKGEDIVTAGDLGIEPSQFVPLDESYKALVL
jgi:hypothetical protein